MSSPTISLSELYAYLKRFHLSDSLYTLAAINSAMKFGFKSLYRDDIPDPVLSWLDWYIANGRVSLELTLLTSRLARFLILSGSNDYKDKMLLVNTPEFAQSHNMVGQLEWGDDYRDESGRPNWSKVFGQLSVWQQPLQENRLTAISRGYLLFISIPSKITSLDYHFDQKLRQHYDIGTFEFMAAGVMLWIKTNGILDYDLQIEIDKLKDTVTDKSINIFVANSTGTAKEYREMIRGEYWMNTDKRKDIFAPEPFMKMPAIRVERSLRLRHGSIIVPQPKYLLDRASTGIFYLLSDREQQIALAEKKPGQNHFRRNFGFVYREYVKMQLSQVSNGGILIDLDIESLGFSGNKRPDFALIIGDTCILFEVKTTLLNISARTYFDEKDLLTAVKNGSIKKAVTEQLHEFRSLILTGRINDKQFAPVKKAINILAGYEDIFVLNSTLLPLLQRLYPDASTGLQLANISDIDAIGTALVQGIDVCAALYAKINDKDKLTWMIESTIKPTIPNPIHEKAYNEFMARMGDNSSTH